MWSKNKPAPTKAESAHIERIKDMACGVCYAHGPSECHELEQGMWFTSIPLCKDCHQGSHNGIHGNRRIWKAKKMTEMSVLNDTIERLME